MWKHWEDLTHCFVHRSAHKFALHGAEELCSRASSQHGRCRLLFRKDLVTGTCTTQCLATRYVRGMTSLGKSLGLAEPMEASKGMSSPALCRGIPDQILKASEVRAQYQQQSIAVSLWVSAYKFRATNQRSSNVRPCDTFVLYRTMCLPPCCVKTELVATWTSTVT